MFCQNLRLRRNFVNYEIARFNGRWSERLTLRSTALRLLMLVVLFSAHGTWLFSQGNSTGARSDFPYQAKIKSETGMVYSGPGLVHYATGELRLGEKVEVYRHDPGGWCAIRPPAKSFSLVPATDIEELEDSLGLILSADVRAWVGTELGPVEVPLWQVKLKQGEKVELLGVVHWPDPDGFSTSWYQISPPAGEFRWIRQEDLEIPPRLKSPAPSFVASDGFEDRQHHRLAVHPSNLPASDNSLPNEGAIGAAGESKLQFGWKESENVGGVVTAGFEKSIDQRQSGFSPTSRNDDPQMGGGSSVGWRRATRPIEAQNWEQPSNLGAANQQFNSVNSNWIADRGQTPDRFASMQPDSRLGLEQLIPITSKINAPLTHRMTELELKLNQEMLREPSQWRLSDIQTATQKVIDTTTDSLEQLQAQQFLAKLENCRRIRDNTIKLAAGGSPSPFTEFNNPERGLERGLGRATSFNEDFSLGTQYDAHGRLNQLVQEGGKREATYVLQDETGKITHHVAPGPGMSLSSYVGKRVGIIGQRGFHTRLKLDHVTASRVIELKDR